MRRQTCMKRLADHGGGAGRRSAPSARPRPAAAKELRILAWQGYADDDWVKAFEKQTDADVSVVYVGTDDEIWAKIKGSEGEDFDLFAVNTAQLQRYIDAGPGDALRPRPDAQPEEDAAALSGPRQGHRRDARRQGLRHPLRVRFDRPDLRQGQGQAGADLVEVLWDPKYQGKVLAYDNGEHNFSFTALTMGIENPFHLSDEQLEAGQGTS